MKKQFTVAITDRLAKVHTAVSSTELSSITTATEPNSPTASDFWLYEVNQAVTKQRRVAELVSKRGRTVQAFNTRRYP